MINEYAQAVDYLYRNLPMFQRIGAAALKKDLTNTLKLCEALGNPHHRLRFIHVAGTNGKGSSSHMLAAILQSAGYKTGLYTSPHLKEFTERIRVNGREADRDYVVAFVNKTRALVQDIKPSFFELTVAMAFDYFVTHKVDVAVLETGMGGRLDSTNVVSPHLSLITNIGKDHADLLGDTLEKIAYEKAGIIKPGTPVVISERQAAVAHVFEEVAARQHAPVFFASDRYRVIANVHGYDIVCDNVPVMDEVNVPLPGSYQQKNIAGVMQAVEQLRLLGYAISDEHLRKGLEGVVELTSLKGRWQKLRDSPLTICDTGHNAEGIREIMNQLREQTFNRLHIVMGVVKDKDLDEIFALLPENASYYFCQAGIPRAMEAAVLEAKARQAGLRGVVIAGVNEAIAYATKMAAPDDLIFVGGSTFVVAEIDNL